MKKSLSTLILVSIISLCFLPFAVPVLADYEFQETEPIIEDGQGALDLLLVITNWLFSILMAVAVIFIIMAAWTFLTAGGNPDSITKARQMLIYALVGVGVAVLARGLPILIASLMAS
jgi:hypothetical protein